MCRKGKMMTTPGHESAIMHPDHPSLQNAEPHVMQETEGTYHAVPRTIMLLKSKNNQATTRFEPE